MSSRLTSRISARGAVRAAVRSSPSPATKRKAALVRAASAKEPTQQTTSSQPRKRARRTSTTPTKNESKSTRSTKGDDHVNHRLPAGYKSPPKADILDVRASLPTRNKYGEIVFSDHPEFRPNLTPAEVLRAGSFGGSYFRTIKSSVTGKTYSGAEQLLEFPSDWFKSEDAKGGKLAKSMLTSSAYNAAANHYGVKCGGDLHMWESSGWIVSIDPYGWFQWYCRFYLGRRSTDDARQISRARGVCGPKGRFRNQLIGKISRAHTTYDDTTISPVIRQALQHWGYRLTQRDADLYIKEKKLEAIPRALASKEA